MKTTTTAKRAKTNGTAANGYTPEAALLRTYAKDGMVAVLYRRETSYGAHAAVKVVVPDATSIKGCRDAVVAAHRLAARVVELLRDDDSSPVNVDRDNCGNPVVYAESDAGNLMPYFELLNDAAELEGFALDE